MADTPRVLSLSETLLHCSGLWPRHSGKMCSLHSFMSHASIPLCALVAACFVLSDQEDLLDSACVVLGTLPLACSSLTLLLQRRRFEDLVSRLRSFAARTLRQDTPRRILLKTVAKERKVLTVCISAVGGVFLAVNCAPVLQQLSSRGERELSCPAYPASTEDDRALLTLEAVQLLVSFVTIAATDGFTASLMLAASCQFEVVAALISGVRVGDPDPGAGAGGVRETASALPGPAAGSDAEPRTHTAATRASTKEEERILAWKEIVAFHQDALRNGNDLCELLRTIFLVYYIATAVDLSLFLFLIDEEEVKSQKIKYAAMVFNVTLRLFLLSYLATDIKSKCEGVAVALAETAWYDYSPEEKTILQVMMCRAQRPVQLWAGKFAVMSLETYLAILTSAYIYYNILNTFK